MVLFRAEINFGKILKEHFQGYRDELIISSKAGHEMWNGPYGGNSSRKNLMASIDQSLSVPVWITLIYFIVTVMMA